MFLAFLAAAVTSGMITGFFPMLSKVNGALLTGMVALTIAILTGFQQAARYPKKQNARLQSS
jgi:hypothetical protein